MFKWILSIFSGEQQEREVITERQNKSSFQESIPLEKEGFCIYTSHVNKTVDLLKDQQTLVNYEYALDLNETLIHRGSFIPFLDNLDRPIWLSPQSDSERYANWCSGVFGIETTFTLISQINVICIAHDWNSHQLQCDGLMGPEWNQILSEALKKLGYEGVLTIQENKPLELMVSNPSEFIKPTEDMKDLIKQALLVEKILSKKTLIRSSLSFYAACGKDFQTYLSESKKQWFKLEKAEVSRREDGYDIEFKCLQDAKYFRLKRDDLDHLDSNYFPLSLRIALYRLNADALVINDDVLLTINR